MTRWLSGIVIVTCLLQSGEVHAQQNYLPQPGFHNTGYIGDAAPGYYAPHGSSPGSLYAQLVPGRNGGFLGGGRPPLVEIDQYLNQAWVRFDYLYWDMKGSGGRFVGAPVAPNAVGEPFDLTGQTTDVTRQLLASDRLGVPRTTLINGILTRNVVVVPQLGEAEEEGISGFRGSFGIPLNDGAIEANGFVFEDLETTSGHRTNPQTVRIGGVPVLIDGNANSSLFVLFSENMNVELSTRLHGFEANWVKRAFTPNASMTISPIVGLRYLKLTDNFLINGTDVPDSNDPTTVLNPRIFTRTQNDTIGPQIGLRAESRMKRFTLGTDLKLLFGVNRVESVLGTRQLFDLTEAPQSAIAEHTEFSPTVDFSVYGKCRATEHINLIVSYQALVGSGYGRAFNQVIYNAPSAVTDPPEFGIAEDTDDFYVHGLVLGLEIILP